jgi:predicted transcriptional regulator
MTHVRTPRQPPSDGLVPLTVQVTPELKQALADLAYAGRRSVSYCAREALQRYLAVEAPEEA